VLEKRNEGLTNHIKPYMNPAAELAAGFCGFLPLCGITLCIIKEVWCTIGSKDNRR
jgi:hypothetical protein